MITFLYILISIIINFSEFEGKVVGVRDGDTIEVLTEQNRVEAIRLAHVDCPEKAQPFGQKAKKFTSDFCFGKTVKIIETSRRDRSGRIIGLVISNNKCLNEALVISGLAWHFKKYSKDIAYNELELKARESKIGLWQDPSPIAPWDWRKSKKKK